jgi:hypothetical protein
MADSEHLNSYFVVVSPKWRIGLAHIRGGSSDQAYGLITQESANVWRDLRAASRRHPSAERRGRLAARGEAGRGR